jgi:hypothetical protein
LEGFEIGVRRPLGIFFCWHSETFTGYRKYLTNRRGGRGGALSDERNMKEDDVISHNVGNKIYNHYNSYYIKKSNLFHQSAVGGTVAVYPSRFTAYSRSCIVL